MTDGGASAPLLKLHKTQSIFLKEVNGMKLEEIQKKLKDIVVDRLNVEESQIKPEASFV